MKFSDSQSMYISSTIDFLINVFVSIAVIVVNSKYVKDLKEDDKCRPPGSNGILVKRVMLTYTKFVIICAPTHLMLIWLLHQDFELPNWFKHLLCYDVYFKFISILYTGFNSLVVAGMRYTFVVHQNQILKFGIEETKQIFYYCSILVPVLIAICHMLTFTRGFNAN